MRPRTGELAPLALAAMAGLLTALAPARAAAQAGRLELVAAVDRTELAEDEVLVLTVRVASDEASPALDLHEDALPFRVLSRAWSTDVSVSLGGGGGVQLVRTRVLTLTLSPKRRGELVIPPVVATVKGVRRQTEPIRVKVAKAAGGARAPAQPPDRSGGSWRGWERDLALEVEVDRREVFLGEQVTAAVWLLSPAGVVDTESYQPPLYDGFWVEEIERPQRLTFQVRSVRGVPIRAYLLQKLALFPTRAGTLELGAFRIEVLLRLGGDSFLSPLSDLRRARRESAPLAIRVKPLPPGAPAGFQAVNVGTWEVEATASDRAVAAGQPVSIRLAASGEGNVRALALPRLPDVPGARRFEETASEDLQRRRGRIGGSRTLETVLVPDAPGELVVPPVAWPYFDPASGRYEVARTEELRIAVASGPAPAAEREPRPGAPELRPIRAGGALAPRRPPPWARSPFLAAVALPPLAFAGLALADAWRRRAARTAPSRRAREAGRRALRRLRTARALAASDRGAALAEVERALAGYARDRLGPGTDALTRAELSAALVAAGAREVAAAALAAARDACDAARFGGGAAPEDVLGLAERALSLLEGSPWTARERTA
jgi:oxygen tolerance protein BatD